MGRSDLATGVSSNGVSMHAVLIVKAAHAISPTDVNRAMWDAVNICSIIVNRYDDNGLLSQVTKAFEDIEFRRWQILHFKWLENWKESMPSIYRWE